LDNKIPAATSRAPSAAVSLRSEGVLNVATVSMG
jgi:hypothetical protein